MSRGPRRNQSSQFKTKVALAARRGDNTLDELAKHFDVHPNQNTERMTQLQSNADVVFRAKRGGSFIVDMEALVARIGGTGAGERFLRRRAYQRAHTECKAMINRPDRLLSVHQAELVGFSRSSVYCSLVPGRCQYWI